MSERPTPPPPPNEQASSVPKRKPYPACLFGKGFCDVGKCGNVGEKAGKPKKRRCVPVS